MTEPLNLEARRPVWVALSEFYLDTELQDSDFRHIAFAILDSPYTFEEVRKIDKYEVFPVLHANLLSVAGEWAGFDEEALVGSITSRLNRKNKFSDIALEIHYFLLKWMFREYWEGVKRSYDKLKL